MSEACTQCSNKARNPGFLGWFRAVFQSHYKLWAPSVSAKEQWSLAALMCCNLTLSVVITPHFLPCFPEVPSAPSISEVRSFSTTAQIEFEEPESTGGVPVLKYSAEWRMQGRGSWVHRVFSADEDEGKNARLLCWEHSSLKQTAVSYFCFSVSSDSNTFICCSNIVEMNRESSQQLFTCDGINFAPIVGTGHVFVFTLMKFIKVFLGTDRAASDIL